MSEDLLRSIDGRLSRIETLATNIVQTMVTKDECNGRHASGRDVGFRVMMALVALGALIVAIVK